MYNYTMFKELPSLERLKEKFFYKNGKLFHNTSPAPWINPGDEAGAIHKISKYHSVMVDNERYQTHRIIWKLVKGEEPIGEIDHINGNRSDNRIKNLRLVDKAANLKNQKKYKNNKSGMPGIYWNEQKKKWCVQVTSDGIQRYYGCFEKLSDAKNKRIEAQAEFSFHKNHGRI